MHWLQLLILPICQPCLMHFLQTITHALQHIMSELLTKLQSLLEWFNMWYLQPWLRTGQGPKWFVVLREMHLRLLRLSVSEYMQILLPWSLPKRTKSMRSMWWKLQSLHIRPKLFILSLWVWFIEWKLHKANKKLYTVTFEWQMFSLCKTIWAIVKRIVRFRDR